MTYQALSATPPLASDGTIEYEPVCSNCTGSHGTSSTDESLASNSAKNSLPLSPERNERETIDQEENRSLSAFLANYSSSSVTGEHPDYKWHTACIALHATFALLHFALIGVMVTNLEKKVHVTLEHSGVWRTGLQISLQSFAVIYLSIVLFVTQKVYVQRMLASKQTLTKSHDESASWLGLGNAISSLYKQRSARSSQFSLSSIVLYLLASAVVKITTSALFQLPTISVPANVTVYATSRKPFPVATSPSDSNDDTNLQQIIMTLASKQWGNFTEPSLRSTIGLYDNTLYDVIPSITNTSGPVEVNSYAVEVQCHAANKSEAVLLGFPDTFGFGPGVLFSPREYGMGSVNENITSDNYRDRGTIFSFISLPAVIDSNNIRSNQLAVEQFAFHELPDGAFQGSSLIYLENDRQQRSANLPKTCTAGMALTLRIGETYPGLLFNVMSAQILMCSVDVIPGRSLVDPQTKRLLKEPTRKKSSFWENPPLWLTSEIPPSSTVFFHAMIDMGKKDGPFAELFCNLTTTSSDALKKAFWSDYALPSQSSTYLLPQFFELYLLWKLNLFHNVSPANETPVPWRLLVDWTPPVLQLHEVEKSLEDYFGLYFWSEQHARENLYPGQIESRTTELVNIPTTKQISQLTLIELPVYVGLAASLVMLAIALWITLTTPVHHSPVDGLGLLQILWLTDSTVTPVSRPTENKLRKKGMEVNVRLGDSVGALRKRTQSLRS